MLSCTRAQTIQINIIQHFHMGVTDCSVQSVSWQSVSIFQMLIPVFKLKPQFNSHAQSTGKHRVTGAHVQC